jgi:hypothetical protein
MFTPTVILPDASIIEYTFGIRTNSSSGLFAYRQSQAKELLQLPDFGDGDLDTKQRREALDEAVNFQKPLTALAIFLGVVALEDFVRDFGARMADNIHITAHFPKLIELRSKPIPRTSDKAFLRLDTDPTGVIDPELVNNLFRESINLEPIPASEYPRLRDLALIRHTVAHHAAVIRHVDVPRFQYYIVKSGQVINPPVDFVRETIDYLYKSGRTIENAILNHVFSKVLPTLSPNWDTTRPAELLELIEFFNYFGFIETTNSPVGYAEPGTPEHDRMKAEAARIKEKLTARCIQDLRERFPT